ncbi:MAG: hypothetical protein JRJ44_09000, partial [Deltaproteobacteria bacterium]|nr:hypothetical protein [Deltaproteobacteria bacterium]
LFQSSTEEVELSNSEQARFEIMKYFNKKCKQLKLGVSLKNKERFHTFKPENPINFWPYKPQHEYDKAPIKNGAIPVALSLILIILNLRSGPRNAYFYKSKFEIIKAKIFLFQ